MRSVGADRRPGFTLIELLVVIAIITILISILLPALAGARRHGRLMVCENNMSTMGKTLGTYAATFQDRIYAFSWLKSTKQSQWSDLNNHTDDLIAASDQAVDILRRRAGREDIERISNLIPHPVLTHLIVMDFLTARMPATEVICPEDKPRLAWAKDPRAFDRKEVFPYPNKPPIIAPGTKFGKIWPYTSSYFTVVATFERIPGSIVQVEDLLYVYYPQIAKLGGNKLADAVFPSQKVLTYDTIKRHFGKDSYWAYDDVQMPLTFFDASVRIKTVGDSNPGWNPREPNTDKSLEIKYSPDASAWAYQWQPPARSPGGTDKFIGRFTWTRGALRGVDFGGGEINTGQPK